MEISQVIRRDFPGRSLSGIGGIETGADAVQFILLGADTVQVCTGVMKMGYGCVRSMLDDMMAFMDRHGFESISDFRGHSLQYFTTHAELVRLQAAAKAAQKSGSPEVVTADEQWRGDDFVKQSDALARG